MKKLIDMFSKIFVDERFLAASVAATLALYAVNLVAKLLCGLYSLFIVDADPGILSYAASVSDGLVIAGAGAGEFSEKYIAVIDKLTIPVVVSSRIDDGLITQDAVLCENTVAANNLSPQKAAILLRLALLDDPDFDGLVRVFSEY